MSVATTWTPKKKEKFLKHLAKHGNVTAACLASGIKRSTAYDIKNSDPEFYKQWEDAVDAATDLLILEMKRRAYKGTKRPVFFQGKECGSIREYSDNLAMFLVKGRRPEYATERRELTGRDGGPVQSQNETTVKITEIPKTAKELLDILDADQG
jgi:hypothetical protein